MDKTGSASEGIIVVGAGIGGLATAVAIHKVGIPVVVLEKSLGLREEGASINIGTNGWKAMDALGVADSLRHKFVAIQRYRTFRDTGVLLKELDVADCALGPHEIRGCIRNDLVKALADALPEGTIRFGASVGSINMTDTGAEVVLDSGETYSGKLVVGADGAYSKVKAALGGPPVQYAGWVTYRGLAIWEEEQPDYAQHFCLMMGGLKQTIVGIYPLDPRRSYYFCGIAADQQEADKLRKGDLKADLARIIKDHPCHMREMVEHTPADHLFLNRIGDRVVQPGEMWGKGSITLIGDAAHPTTPALGQGGCMALEDGVELGAALRDATVAAGVKWAELPAATIEATLRNFERRRSTRCAPLVAQARRNGQGFTTRRSSLGVWWRDFMFKCFAYNPVTQFDYMVWDPPSLDKPCVA